MTGRFHHEGIIVGATELVRPGSAPPILPYGGGFKREAEMSLASQDPRKTTRPGRPAGENVCLEHACIECCRGTEMALLEEDIQRLESLGFARERFAVESKGLVVLRNLHHRCFFHDGTRCTVYDVRPMGCRLYPVVYAEYSGTGALDRLCPFRDEFNLSPESKRGSAELFHRLIKEARLRKARGPAIHP